MQELAAAGAPEEILYLAKPHIGTDKLAVVVRRIREKIVSLGGEYRFENRLENLIVRDGKLTGLKIAAPGGKIYEQPTDRLILAVGHSARDTFEMLHKNGVYIEQKPFSVGVRIEHVQKSVDAAQYGRFAGHPALGAADYKLAAHFDNGRSAYTFCMCPGGMVVAAASEPGRVVTNGMSEFARDGKTPTRLCWSGLSLGILAVRIRWQECIFNAVWKRPRSEPAAAIIGRRRSWSAIF